MIPFAPLGNYGIACPMSEQLAPHSCDEIYTNAIKLITEVKVSRQIPLINHLMSTDNPGKHVN